MGGALPREVFSISVQAALRPRAGEFPCVMSICYMLLTVETNGQFLKHPLHNMIYSMVPLLMKALILTLREYRARTSGKSATALLTVCPYQLSSTTRSSASTEVIFCFSAVTFLMRTSTYRRCCCCASKVFPDPCPSTRLRSRPSSPCPVSPL
jgi:hypothetical protein